MILAYLYRSTRHVTGSRNGLRYGSSQALCKLMNCDKRPRFQFEDTVPSNRCRKYSIPVLSGS
jgi:hypothetical protein